MPAFLRRSYDGAGATTTLANSMGSSDTSFVLAAATGWPGAAAANFIVVVDRGTASEEKILCASNSGTTVTVASSGRGYDGTSATTHNATATVSLCGGAIDFDETNQISNLLGNAAAGSLIIGAGAGTLPTKLAVGAATSILAGGTTPAYVSASNGQFFGVTAGAVAAVSLTLPTVLSPIAKSSSYAAVNGNFVNVTATATITSPTATAGVVFGAIANYGASNASPVTLTTASGFFIGPGIPASTSSILLGAVGAHASFISDGTNWYVTSGAQDTGWVTLSLLNSFATSGVAPAIRLIGNRVIFRGAMNTGSSGTEPFVVPSGYRPSVGVFANVSAAAGAQLQVGTNGVTQCSFTGSPILGLDGTNYTTD